MRRLFHFIPILSRADLHLQGRIERIGVLHQLADERFDCVLFFLRRFEDQFVVDLQNQSRFEFLLALTRAEC